MTERPDRGACETWLAQARRDLDKASAMSEIGVFEPCDVCAYAQQAAEKSLKAVLVLTDAGIPRLHDLRELRSRCGIRIAPHLCDDRLDFLSALWTSSRYPGDWQEPTREDAHEALLIAREVVSDSIRIIAEKEST